MTKEQKPKIGVGIGVMILKDGQVLMHRRKFSHGVGEYSFPGGHLEYLETFEQCARRETKEECGIEIKNIRFQFLANIRSYKPKHYVHVGLIADWQGGEVQNLEPDKAELWGWYNLNNLPEPLFEFSKLGIKSYQKNQNYFDL